MHLRHSIDGIIKNVTYGDNYLIGKQLVQSGNSDSLHEKKNLLIKLIKLMPLCTSFGIFLNCNLRNLLMHIHNI